MCFKKFLFHLNKSLGYNLIVLSFINYLCWTHIFYDASGDEIIALYAIGNYLLKIFWHHQEKSFFAFVR
jgi:hypothetical protein